MDTEHLKQKYPHLGSPALGVIESDDTARMKFISSTLKDKIWLPNIPSDTAVDDLMNLAMNEDSLRPECRFIVGPSNNGKSRILTRFARESRKLFKRDPEGVTMPIVCIQAPENPSIGGFFNNVLRAVGAPTIPGSDAKKAKDSALRICREIGMRVLVIDEVQHLASGTTTHRGQCLNAIKAMTTELGRSIVAAGTPEGIEVMSSLDQVENRFLPWILDLWEMGDSFLELLDSFEGVLPLHKASNLADEKMAALILKQSEGRIGEVYFLLRNAAKAAIVSKKECIDLQLLKSLNYQGPSLRKESLDAFAKKCRQAA